MHIGLHVKYPLSCHSLSDMNFLDIFLKKNQIRNIAKSRSVGAEFFHTDEWTARQTDTTKLSVAFRNFANAPKIIQIWVLANVT
jgi:hypothetical protein